MRLPGLVRLVHPFPVAVVVVTSSLLATLLLGNEAGFSSLARVVGAVAASQIGVGALNDFSDRYADGHFQPRKPIPSGEVSPQRALLLATGALLCTILVAGTFGIASLAVACVALGGGIAYDLGLKGTVWSVACYLVGLLGLFAWLQVITHTSAAPLLLVYPGGACIITAAHLANAAPDIESDAARGLTTISVKLGPRGSVLGIYALYAAVCLPCLAIALLARSFPAIILTLLSAGLCGAALLTTRRLGASRYGRVILFRAVSPALGLLALAGLIGIQSLGR